MSDVFANLRRLLGMYNYDVMLDSNTQLSDPYFRDYVNKISKRKKDKKHGKRHN